MSDEQFNEYVIRCLKLIESRNDKLSKDFGLGTFEHWDLSQTTRTLTFSDNNKNSVTFLVDAIGSHSSSDWRWAWANESLEDTFKQESNQLKQLAQTTGFQFFKNPSFEADSHMAWEISGMALELIGGLGVYRCPSAKSAPFVLLKKVVSHST